MGLTKTQTAAACLLLAASPIVYQWKLLHDFDVQRASLQARLTESQQALEAARNAREALGQRSNPLTVAAAVSHPRSAVGTAVQAKREPSLWSEDSPYIEVPRAVLDRIQIPAVGQNGLIAEEMAQALGLDDKQSEQANQSLAKFREQYQALEAAHIHPSDERTTAVNFSPVKDQKTFVIDAFPEQYDALKAELTGALTQVLGQANSDFFWKNAQGNDQPVAFDSSYARQAKRITLFCPQTEQPGGGPYYVAREYQNENGNWYGAATQPLDEATTMSPLLPQIKAVIDQWKTTPRAR